jgi:hypothetical protein
MRATVVGACPDPCHHRTTVQRRAGLYGHVSGNVAFVVRSVWRVLNVFTGGVQVGQTAFQVWDWTNHIGVLW